MTALQASGISVRLGDRTVLDGVDAVLRSGRLTAIVGPNGAGKTTLLKTLAGLQAPTRGTILLDGAPLERMTARERARRIAYLAQGGTVAWPIPVRDVVALGRLPHGEVPDRLGPGESAVSSALAAVGLAALASRPASSLSGGERARALLARALATESAILLADEPVAALDPRHQLIVLDVLQERARAGGTIACIMHDLALAARYADEVLLLKSGRIEASGTPREVLTAPRLADAFGIEAEVKLVDGWPLIIPRHALTIDEFRHNVST
ncbi:ABC transporter ATP-binding protein [Microvirga massiliensis]|uniref:ABC transporter ATP-binding protein n=1 Tax=Microvirga massiliensis TaxID=1033741 RepID=UPI00062BA846|nr:ATP-binding cassette domain-containing protein [Microvirga massiliensis]